MPGGRPDASYTPEALVRTTLVARVNSSVTAIGAPATVPPADVLTVPAIVPVPVWAAAAPDSEFKKAVKVRRVTTRNEATTGPSSCSRT